MVHGIWRKVNLTGPLTDTPASIFLLMILRFSFAIAELLVSVAKNSKKSRHKQINSNGIRVVLIIRVSL